MAERRKGCLARRIDRRVGEMAIRGKPVVTNDHRITKDASEEQHRNVTHVHFTASERVNNDLETVAGASLSSICNFFVAMAEGIFGMDRGSTG
jgi:hypothetical protein